MADFSPSSYDGLYVANANWTTARSATSGTSRGGNPYASCYLHTNTNYVIDRTFFVFNTSTIPDNMVVTSATISLTGNNSMSGAQERHYAFYDTSCSDTVATTDFDLVGTTILSDQVAHSSLTLTGTFTWNLNAAGLAAISLTGNTKFALREVDKDASDTAPSPAALVFWKFTSPVLTVNYSLPQKVSKFMTTRSKFF